MLSRTEFISDKERVFDKVYGALIGIAIGDSFGDAARMADNRANYQVTTDFNKGSSWSTDDTEFAQKQSFDAMDNLPRKSVLSPGWKMW